MLDRYFDRHAHSDVVDFVVRRFLPVPVAAVLVALALLLSLSPYVGIAATGILAFTAWPPLINRWTAAQERATMPGRAS